MLWKKTKFRLTVNGETALAPFIWLLLPHVLGENFCVSPFLIGRILWRIRFWDETFCEGSVFEMKYFVKGLFLRRNILWRVCFWDETFCEGSIFKMKNFVKGPLMDPVLSLDRPLAVYDKFSNFILSPLHFSDELLIQPSFFG